MKIRKSAGDWLFNICNTALMLMLVIVTVYPFWFVAAASVSAPAQVVSSRGLMLWPKQLDFSAYLAVLKNPNITTGYINTIFYLLAGTALNISFTVLLAYALSRRVKYAPLFMKLIVFTMFFSGGMIPAYMLVRSLQLVGTVWSILLPSLISTYNLIILRTAFKSVPESLEESARLDGANDFDIMVHVVVPLSLPSIAVIVLYYAVGHWNAWFNASLYLTDRSMYPLQLILREILVVNTMDSMSMQADVQDRVSVEQTIKYATIMVATIPILCIYPFLQKYFVKGVMIGAIKE